VKELEKLYSVQVKRVVFMLVFKYGFQMNVQVSLFMLKAAIRTAPKHDFNLFAAGGELLSIAAMMLGIASEFCDLYILLLTFWDIQGSVSDCLQGKKEDDKAQQKDGNQNLNIRSSVCECFKKIRSSVSWCCTKKEGLLGRHFFKDGNEDKEELITFADLKIEYIRIWVTTLGMVLSTGFAIWLIGYELMKFIGACFCLDSHIWTWFECLPKESLTNFFDHTCNDPTWCKTHTCD